MPYCRANGGSRHSASWFLSPSSFKDAPMNTKIEMIMLGGVCYVVKCRIYVLLDCMDHIFSKNKINLNILP